MKLVDKIFAGAIAAVLGLVFLLSGAFVPAQIAVAEPIGDNYYVFSQDKYQSTSTTSKATLLNFYADWCATCNVMEPVLIDLMSEIGYRENISAFRVNIGDSSESPQSKQLASDLGVAQQSTLVVLNSKGEVFKSFLAPVDREILRQAMLAASLT
jgi:thiol:disulfide interchange protein